MWTNSVGSWRWTTVLGLWRSDIEIRHLLRQGFLSVGDQVILRVPFRSRMGPCHLVWAVCSRRERGFVWAPNDHHLLPCRGGWSVWGDMYQVHHMSARDLGEDLAEKRGGGWRTLMIGSWGWTSWGYQAVYVICVWVMGEEWYQQLGREILG